MGKRKLKTQAKVLIVAVAMVVSLAGYYLYNQQSTPSNKTKVVKKENGNIPVSCFLGDVQYIDLNQVIPHLKKSKMTTITVPITWSEVEKNEGEWDYSIYDKSINRLVKEGFNFIFIIDASGRTVMDANKNPMASSIPSFITSKLPNCLAKQSDGVTTPVFDYVDKEHLKYVKEFYNKTITYLKKFKKNIVALTPGIMTEFEIKYFQSSAKWNDYNNTAKKQYRQYLKSKYKTIDKLNKKTSSKYSSFNAINMPVPVTGGVNNALLKQSSLFSDFVDFREQVLVDYVKNFTDIIHENNYETLGYFGQFHSSFDGIYSTNAIDKMTKCFDSVVVDYNFYTGYNTIYNSSITPYLVNYAKNVGYKKVYAGTYFERVKVDDYQDTIIEVKEKLQKDNKATGVEVGGVYPFSDNEKVNLSFQRSSENNDGTKIALYVSKETFIRDNIEQKSYINYLTDTAVETYNILRFKLGYDVDVIGDDYIKNKKLDKYHAIVAPGQLFVSDECIDSLDAYKKSGGAILSDIGIGEYDTYGKLRNNSSNRVVSNTNSTRNITNLYKDGEKVLDVQRVEYAIPSIKYTYPKGKSLYTNASKRQIGYIGDNEIIIGFQPQILYKETERDEYAQIYKECLDYLINK